MKMLTETVPNRVTEPWCSFGGQSLRIQLSAMLVAHTWREGIPTRNPQSQAHANPILLDCITLDIRLHRLTENQNPGIIPEQQIIGRLKCNNISSVRAPRGRRRVSQQRTDGCCWGLISTPQDMFGGESAEFWRTFICHNHQQACTLVTLLKGNNRVPNYFGKYAVIDVFLPFSLRDIISALHVDI